MKKSGGTYRKCIRNYFNFFSVVPIFKFKTTFKSDQKLISTQFHT